MLDVHAPHKPIHGVGEFFLHLLTITIGLLIAVGIEGLVTRHEHRKLAEDARATMRVEIENNAGNVKEALKEIAGRRAAVARSVTYLQAVIAHPNSAPNGHLDATFNTVGFEHTAWRTAQATGALSYMPYQEAQRLSGVYEAAEQLETMENGCGEDVAQVLGLVRRYNVGDGQLSKEAAEALAERFGVWQMHLLQVDLAARLLAEEQDAYLQGREPKHALSEKLGN